MKFAIPNNHWFVFRGTKNYWLSKELFNFNQFGSCLSSISSHYKRALKQSLHYSTSNGGNFLLKGIQCCMLVLPICIIKIIAHKLSIKTTFPNPRSLTMASLYSLHNKEAFWICWSHYPHWKATLDMEWILPPQHTPLNQLLATPINRFCNWNTLAYTSIIDFILYGQYWYFSIVEILISRVKRNQSHSMGKST